MQIRLMIDILVQRLKEFMENEVRSCSMDLTLSKPTYARQCKSELFIVLTQSWLLGT